ncbi:MAG TPA: cytochrome C oxidase subunit IV family protein [Anaeromyxobacter sp.]|nr:cytochrome C oxidase subunit IV family protein [Anaeromyxobacter sp.]
MSDVAHPPLESGAARHASRGRAQYLWAFGVLAVLTLVELGVARTPGIPRGAAIPALVCLAIAKAALIALFYMHLRYETRVLRLTVLGPLVAPAVYGLALMADATWRLLR